MAKIRLSRKKGFIFGALVVENKQSINGDGAYLLDVQMNLSPQPDYFESTAQGRHGGLYFFNRYQDKDITLKIGIYSRKLENRKAIQKDILGNIPLRKQEKLTFLDDLERYYIAEILGSIGIVEAEIMTEITIPLRTFWCMYGQEKNIVLSKGINKIISNGNFEAQAIFSIKATKKSEKIVISNGENSFTLASLNSGEEVFIDSEKMIVYTEKNKIKESAMAKFTGNFLKIDPGINEFTVSGTYEAEIKLKYKDTYIV